MLNAPPIVSVKRTARDLFNRLMITRVHRETILFIETLKTLIYLRVQLLGAIVKHSVVRVITLQRDRVNASVATVSLIRI